MHRIAMRLLALALLAGCAPTIRSPTEVVDLQPAPIPWIEERRREMALEGKSFEPFDADEHFVSEFAQQFLLLSPGLPGSDSAARKRF